MEKQVRAINADKTLTAEEKSKKIQELFTKRYQAPTTSNTQATKVCKHYLRNCDIETPCCKKWYSCRLCHDENEDHTLVRGLTKLMKCRICQVIQPVNEFCAEEGCEWKKTLYYCQPCRLWSDDEKKQIFHCEGCGICRIGKREENWHCDRCRLCIPIKQSKESHNCIANTADEACPVCSDYMQDSVRGILFLPCGHTLHCDCHDALLKKSTYLATCPKCRKSIYRDLNAERNLIAELKQIPMPKEHARKCIVFCNDCEKKSKTNIHWMGIHCLECGSFNTSILKTFEIEDDEEHQQHEEEEEEEVADTNEQTTTG